MEKINLYESFAGIGSQYLALKRLSKKNKNFDVNVVGICEWDIYALYSYINIHFPEIEINEKTKNYESLKKFIYNNDFSSDSKSVAKKEHLLKDEKNLKVISKIKNFSEKVKLNPNIEKLSGKDLIDLKVNFLTYSFPCQDLSNAGKRKGFERGSNTRSSLLWEIERIIEEIFKINKNKLPKYLLLENVASLLNKKNKSLFLEWIDFLSNKGYKTFYDKLNAKDFSIPQNRIRTFAFSILNYEGEYKEKESLDEIIKDFNSKNKIKNKIKPMEKFLKIDYKNDNYSLEARDSSPNHTKSRERMWNESEIKLLEYDENDIPIPNEKQIFSGTLTTKQDRWHNGGMIQLPKSFRKKYYDKSKNPLKEYRYRFLTPTESLLLMGFKENEIENVIKSINNELKRRHVIHQAGNTIVVDILEKIFEIFIL
ncbi:MAG: cytosine-specific methyltransferase [Candidatus Hepatoplasma scabrum]|nr:MAG: cytosine-specific methyltransferase [Candidatus Hepatoplasma sp.]